MDTRHIQSNKNIRKSFESSIPTHVPLMRFQGIAHFVIKTISPLAALLDVSIFFLQNTAVMWRLNDKF